MEKSPPNVIIATSLLFGGFLIPVVGIGIFFNFFDLNISSVMGRIIGGIMMGGGIFAFVIGIVLLLKTRKMVKTNPNYHAPIVKRSFVKLFTVFLVIAIAGLIITLGGMLITGGSLKDFSQFLIPIVLAIITIAYYRHHLKSKEKSLDENPQQTYMEK